MGLIFPIRVFTLCSSQRFFETTLFRQNACSSLFSFRFVFVLGRTDLRIGASEAKFDLEDDFDVKNSLAPPKSAENHEKPKIFSKKIFRCQKNESCKSSETRFPEVSCRSEPSSRGELTFEVRIFMVEYVRFFSLNVNVNF